jgi:hypothetical protein
MPSFRTPPPGCGISTRFTACGRYVPASRAARLVGHCSRRYPGSAATVIPSPPELPPCRCTRASAARRFSRATTCAIRRSSPTGGSRPAAPTAASPRRSATGSSSCSAGARPRSHIQCTLLPTVRAFSTPARASSALCCLLPAGGRGFLLAPFPALANSRQISQGTTQHFLRVAAGLIKCTQTADGGRRGHGPTRPRCTTPPIRFRCVAPRLGMGRPADATSR